MNKQNRKRNKKQIKLDDLKQVRGGAATVGGFKNVEGLDTTKG